jgi:hypothetical protein
LGSEKHAQMVGLNAHHHAITSQKQVSPGTMPDPFVNLMVVIYLFLMIALNNWRYGT